MRVLITGAGGQLATYLEQAFGGSDVTALTHAELDITDEPQVNSQVADARPDLVVNTAAFHNLPECEKDIEASFNVNARGPYLLGMACRKISAKLVHISTDYVFGNANASKPFVEGDLPAPQSVYAMSKLAGEHLVAQATDSHIVIRTCGLYGARGSAGKSGNFVLTMLRLARDRGAVRVVNDQICAPTYAKHLAGAIAALSGSGRCGTFHVVNSGSCTWLEFALEIFRISGLNPSAAAIRSDEFFDGVKRPVYSVLDCSRYEKVTSCPMPSWKDGLGDYLAEIGESAAAGS